MAGEYYRWYREGTVTVTQNSTSIVGVDTYWVTAGLHPGDMFSIDGAQEYEVKAVTDNTHITLMTAYAGNSETGSSYRIIRNFTATSGAEIAAKTAELYGDMARYWDSEHTTIHGKSAYEIAKTKGYTGTESEWLESLKAAGEWTTLNNRTQILTYNSAMAHNAVARGKNLGTAITAEQVAAIRAGTFADLYPGDYWTLNGWISRIVGLNCYRGLTNSNHAVLLVKLLNHPVNDTDTVEGGMLAMKVWTTLIPQYTERLEGAIGTGSLISIPGYISDSVDSSNKANHWAQVNSKMYLPSRFNFEGIFRTGEKTECLYNNVQFPLFKLTTVHAVQGNTWCWLNEVYPYSLPKVMVFDAYGMNDSSMVRPAYTNTALYVIVLLG